MTPLILFKLVPTPNPAIEGAAVASGEVMKGTTFAPEATKVDASPEEKLKSTARTLVSAFRKGQLNVTEATEGIPKNILGIIIRHQDLFHTQIKESLLSPSRPASPDKASHDTYWANQDAKSLVTHVISHAKTTLIRPELGRLVKGALQQSRNTAEFLLKLKINTSLLPEEKRQTIHIFKNELTSILSGLELRKAGIDLNKDQMQAAIQGGLASHEI